MSSTHKNRLLFPAIGISITYISNNKGPSIDPCGPPHNMFGIFEKKFSRFIGNEWFDAKNKSI